jgi:plasmid stability protein
MERNKMPSITIREVAPDIHQFIRKQGAEHGRSMEEEARYILKWYKDVKTVKAGDFARRVHQLFKEAGGGDDIEFPEQDQVSDSDFLNK